MRRVVVTGMGVVAPNGVGVEAFCRALRSGTCAVRPYLYGDGSVPSRPRIVVRSAHHPREPSRAGRGRKRPYLVAEVPAAAFSPNGLDRFIAYGLMAAEEAVTTSGLDLSALDPETVGAVFSSSKGGMATLEKGVSSEWMAQFPTSSASSVLLRRYPIRGPVLNLVTACATGTHALIRGAQLIREGYASVVLAGASDASLTPLLLSAYDRMGVLTHRGVFPFDRRRSGFAVGEGAGCFVLEEETHALRRGAPLYGEIAGYAVGQDPFHPLRFNPESSVLAMLLLAALRSAGAAPEDVDYIHAHGTATHAGDLYETEQLKRAFGGAAYRIPVSSTKSMTGHLLGAAGAVAFAAVLLAMKARFVPPTVGLSEPDPSCDLDYVPQGARSREVATALSVSMGFGGHIGIIVVRKG